MHIFSVFLQSNFVYENFPLYEELYLSIIIDICNIWYVKIMSFPIIIFQRIYFFYLLLFGFVKYFIKLGCMTNFPIAYFMNIYIKQTYVYTFFRDAIEIHISASYLLGVTNLFFNRTDRGGLIGLANHAAIFLFRGEIIEELMRD